MTDNRGTTIAIGQEVAYNLAGQVAKGTVIDTRKTKKEGRLIPPIMVRLEHQAAGFPKGHISKVAHENNLLVLQKAPCPNCGQSPAPGEA